MKKLVVFIGRFSPRHDGHLAVLKKAKEFGQKTLVLIGSAFSPRTIKNPYTADERAQMLAGHADFIEYLHDYFYNDDRWAAQVQSIVESFGYKDDEITLIGHTKDKSSYYLGMFPQWEYVEVTNNELLNSTDIRKDLFEGRIENTIIPQKEFQVLCREYEADKRQKKAWSVAPYPPIFTTLDTVLIQSGHILLIKRKSSPGEGLWALPGGFLEVNERLVDGALRELDEETRVEVSKGILRDNIRRKEVFDHPDRSLGIRKITHAFLITLRPGKLPRVKGGDDASRAKWFSLNEFLDMESVLFEDHFSIVTEMTGIA